MLTINATMNFKTKLAIAIAIFLWASAFVGIRAGLVDYSPEGLALLRYLVASFCMGLIYFRLPKTKRTINHKRDLLSLLFIGVFGIGVYNLSLNYGELSISSGMSSFIISQSPIVTAIVAIIFLGEKINLLRVIGFAVSVLGVFFIALGEIGGFKWDISVAYIILATIAGGCYSVMQKPFLKKYHAISATTFIVWGGTLFLLIYLPQLRQDMLTASLRGTVMVIYLGIFPAAIGYMAWSYALSHMPASHAVSFLYYTPFLATALGWLYLGEVPVLLSVIGGLLAIVGVWIVNHSYKRLAEIIKNEANPA